MFRTQNGVLMPSEDVRELSEIAVKTDPMRAPVSAFAEVFGYAVGAENLTVVANAIAILIDRIDRGSVELSEAERLAVSEALRTDSGEA